MTNLARICFFFFQCKTFLHLFFIACLLYPFFLCSIFSAYYLLLSKKTNLFQQCVAVLPYAFFFTSVIRLLDSNGKDSFTDVNFSLFVSSCVIIGCWWRGKERKKKKSFVYQRSLHLTQYLFLIDTWGVWFGTTSLCNNVWSSERKNYVFLQKDTLFAC